MGTQEDYLYVITVISVKAKMQYPWRASAGCPVLSGIGPRDYISSQEMDIWRITACKIMGYDSIYCKASQ